MMRKIFIVRFLRNGWYLFSFTWDFITNRCKATFYRAWTLGHHLFIKNGSSAFEEYVIGEPHEKIPFHAFRIAKENH